MESQAKRLPESRVIERQDDDADWDVSTDVSPPGGGGPSLLDAET